MIGGLDTRRCTSRAPASNIICTIFLEVVPRTTLSSISTMRLPRTAPALAECLSLTPSWRMRCSGSMKVRPDVVVADDAELEGDAALLGVADGGGHAGVGDRDDHVGLGRRLARELRAHRLRRS